jgi:hypothetical protein
MSCFSKVKTITGAITSCIWSKTLGEVSTAEVTVPMVCAMSVEAISTSSPPLNLKGLPTLASEVSPLF